MAIQTKPGSRFNDICNVREAFLGSPRSLSLGHGLFSGPIQVLYGPQRSVWANRVCFPKIAKTKELACVFREGLIISVEIGYTFRKGMI